MIREVACETAIGFEYPPDGSKLPVIDPYDGCQFRCPYCFQWADRDWNKDILVKTNLPEVLPRDLENLDLTQPLYVGSRCDPYMPLENHYRLTRQALAILRAHRVPCTLSTKASSRALLRDTDLFLDYGADLTVCIGQANLHHLRRTRDQRSLPNIATANRLARLGVRTWVFITPVLPGITDVEAMIGALDGGIRVLLDKVRLSAGDPPAPRFLRFIRASYPELEPRYRALLAEGTDPYYEELRLRYGSDPRVSFVFGDK